MNFEQTIPDQHFPIRDELLGRTQETGPLGDVARALAEGVGKYHSFHPTIGELATRVMEAGTCNSMPIIATLAPSCDVWVEVVPRQGPSSGCLFGPGQDGTVWMRHIEGGRYGAAATCLPVSLLVGPHGDRPAVDWEAVRGKRFVQDDAAGQEWQAWGLEHLLFESLNGRCYSDPATDYFGKICAVDLVVAAMAMAPVWPARSGWRAFVE